MPTLAKANEVVAGYKLKNRLGAGGYGEVWSAEAPGGLLKAVKFVYGYLDEERAKREWKSLNRIKDVRHPFLLSLERIEIVEGQLVIVTELADSSLKERFVACRKQGLPGVPRDELLVYIRDTAEALDFMRQKHELQHLDVKPENLLLLGGRVKVADFGLVKDVGERTFTMMGGLTPLYAPPEVFEGHPSRHSDQYSLAIVFQELLTGRVPFSGKSAARLGLQHAKAPPDLSSLPESDRPALERALAKDPNRRFASCLELAEALTAGAGSSAHGDARPARTAAGAAQPPLSDSQRVPHLRRLLQSRPITNGKPFDMLNTSQHCRPTLFLGFGGTAGAVLNRLKQRLHRRFAGQEVEAIRFLQTDIDQRSLSALTTADGVCLSAEETLALPLRRAEHYRTRTGYQKWVSRRWLYNIPRSLTTEGLRPLGRLAFVDNAPKLFDRIRQELRRITDPGVLERSSQAARAPFEATCRVVLVASVSGATGGGMVLDAAYAARQIAAELGLQQAQLCGVLAHATSSDWNERELGVVNAYATLKELLYYRQIRYPGDADCGLNPAAGDRAAFDDIYFAVQGEAQREFQDLVEEISEYLYVDTATEGGAFMDACRRAARRSTDESDDCYVQLFGVHRREFLHDRELAAHVTRLAGNLVRWWRGVDPEPPAEDPKDLLLTDSRPHDPIGPQRREKLDALAAEAAPTLNLDQKILTARADQLIAEELNTNSSQLLRGLVCGAREQAESSVAWWARCHDDLQRLLGDTAEVAGGTPLGGRILDRLREQAATTAARIAVWLKQAFALTTVRLAGARYLGDAFLERLQGYVDEQAELATTLRKRLAETNANVEQALLPKDRRRGPASPEELEALIQRAAEIRFAVFQADLTRRFLRTMQARLNKEIEAFLDLDIALRTLAPEDAGPTPSAANPFLDELTTDARLPRVISDQIVRELGLEPTDLYAALQRLTRKPADSAQRIAERAQATLLEAVSRMEETPEVAQDSAEQLKRCLDAAAPKLRDCGGRQRLLIMAPASMKKSVIRKGITAMLGVTPSVICTGFDFLACYELEKVSLPRIAAQLVEGRQDFVDCASRVHTRNDIDWDDAFVS